MRFNNMNDLRRAIADGDVELNDIVEPKTQGSSPVKAHASTSHLELAFATTWSILDGPELEEEYKFHPERRWRFDFAHLATKIAVEVEGGAYGMGRHNRTQGFMADAEKYFAATMAGWTVIRLTSNMITPSHLEQIIRFIRERENDGT